MSILKMKQVWKHYLLGETRVEALRGIDLQLEPGELVVIWGPSGCGKSTLCNLIGLLDTPTSGELELMGSSSLAFSDDRKSELRNELIGFVFQNFNLIPVLSALENVMLPLQIRGRISREARKRAEECLEEMGLSSHLHHRPHKLSGGQQQRVAIARALVNRPSLVIADEPTANLDSENAQKIIDLMRAMNEKGETTFVFSTHDQRLISHARRRIHLRDGVIAEDRTVDPGPTHESEIDACLD